VTVVGGRRVGGGGGGGAEASNFSSQLHRVSGTVFKSTTHFSA
jgi:hypothetical protein